MVGHRGRGQNGAGASPSVLEIDKREALRQRVQEEADVHASATHESARLHPAARTRRAPLRCQALRARRTGSAVKQTRVVRMQRDDRCGPPGRVNTRGAGVRACVIATPTGALRHLKRAGSDTVVREPFEGCKSAGDSQLRSRTTGGR
ncbi:hypothetical protein FB451DRAFT_1168486 [Mycena latifolia]|nr:hypothetical protein FB451DRAFT_1168486 [Mycena latifolia]